MALADMPKAFDETELAKGFFPHLYNRVECQSSVLNQLPNIWFYNPDGMKPENRAKVLLWYEQQRMHSFDFQAALLWRQEMPFIEVAQKLSNYTRKLVLKRSLNITM